MSEKYYAQYKLVEQIVSSGTPLNATELTQYLLHETEWGAATLNPGADIKDIKRPVQRLLQQIAKSSEFEKIINVETAPDTARTLLYSSRVPYKENPMRIEEACYTLLAKKYISKSFPDLLSTELTSLFERAETALKNYEYKPKNKRYAVRKYMNRIAVAPRGMELKEPELPENVLRVISEAMLKRKCVKFHYKGKSRLVHPYGLVFRDPKILLLAVSDKAMTEKGPNKTRPFQYICSRISEPQITQQDNQVPDDFSVEKYVAEGRMDVPLKLTDQPADSVNSKSRSVTLTVRIYKGDTDNLVRDLEEFPLSRQQTIEREGDSDNFLLRARGIRVTFALMNWIMGRGDRIEVLEPKNLRKKVMENIGAMQQRYEEP